MLPVKDETTSSALHKLINTLDHSFKKYDVNTSNVSDTMLGAGVTRKRILSIASALEFI